MEAQVHLEGVEVGVGATGKIKKPLLFWSFSPIEWA